jgi:hypothetical protein
VDFLKRFWAVLASLAGIAALYVGAEAIHLVIAFWIVVGLAFLAAGARPALRGAGELAVRIRNYPRLLERVVDAETKVQSFNDEKTAWASELASAKEEGKRIVLARLRGMILAGNVDPPDIIGIGDDDGSIALIGKYETESKPVIGAWYSVVGTVTRSSKGNVSVSRISDADRTVWMVCVEPVAPEFWHHLSSRVSYDDSPPTNVTLAQYQLEFDSLMAIDDAAGPEIHEVKNA